MTSVGTISVNFDTAGVREGLRGMTSSMDNAKKAVDKFEGGLGKFAGGLSSITSAFGGAESQTAKYAGALQGIAAGFVTGGPVGAALAAGSAAIDIMSDKMKKAEERAQKLAAAFDAVIDPARKLRDAAVGETKKATRETEVLAFVKDATDTRDATIRERRKRAAFELEDSGRAILATEKQIADLQSKTAGLTGDALEAHQSTLLARQGEVALLKQVVNEQKEAFLGIEAAVDLERAAAEAASKRAEKQKAIAGSIKAQVSWLKEITAAGDAATEVILERERQDDQTAAEQRVDQLTRELNAADDARALDRELSEPLPTKAANNADADDTQRLALNAETTSAGIGVLESVAAGAGSAGSAIAAFGGALSVVNPALGAFAGVIGALVDRSPAFGRLYEEIQENIDNTLKVTEALLGPFVDVVAGVVDGLNTLLEWATGPLISAMDSFGRHADAAWAWFTGGDSGGGAGDVLPPALEPFAEALGMGGPDESTPLNTDLVTQILRETGALDMMQSMLGDAERAAMIKELIASAKENYRAVHDNTDAVREMSESFSNVPDGLRVALSMYRAETPLGSSVNAAPSARTVNTGPQFFGTVIFKHMDDDTLDRARRMKNQSIYGTPERPRNGGGGN